jgi:transketolase
MSGFGALEAQARRVRGHAIRMATNGGCFLGASLSCADILVYLYDRVLRVAPDRLDDPQRDYLLLSKGHDVPALYGTLAERGYFPRERLAKHLDIDDHLYWHPNRAIPGVEFHSGSLGHLLSVGMGIAVDARLRGGASRVFVIVGDGELDEGSIWEAALVAGAKKLDNLVVIVDRNGFQANLATEELIPLEPIADKLAAFGFAVADVDGHSFPALEAAFATLPRAPGRPTAIIARTVRNKGLPSLEGRAERWFVDLKPEEVTMLLAELDGAAAGELQSAPLVVR